MKMDGTDRATEIETIESRTIETIYMDMTAGPDEAALRRAGAIIRSGGLVAFPTETVYGLGGNALQADSSRKIYAAKGRPSDNPLIVHIAELSDLAPIVKRVPAQTLTLAKRFWPGPLTMILEKNGRVPLATTGGLETVAVRMPDHPLALALIRESGGYIAAPSANTSGRPSPTRASHVMEDLGGRIDAVIDGGSVGIGLESTIVDLTGEVPAILRPGYIDRQMLEEALGLEVTIDPGLAGTDPAVRPKAPGMKYRHYAPKASLTIVEGEPAAVTGRILSLVEKDRREGKRTGVITCSEDALAYETETDACIVRSLGSFHDEIRIANNLYAALREFDSLDVDEIYSEAFNTPRIGQAIMNRLMKAAGGHVILA